MAQLFTMVGQPRRRSAARSSKLHTHAHFRRLVSKQVAFAFACTRQSALQVFAFAPLMRLTLKFAHGTRDIPLFGCQER